MRYEEFEKYWEDAEKYRRNRDFYKAADYYTLAGYEASVQAGSLSHHLKADR